MSQRVVIVGAGVIGLSLAWYCAQRGFHVTLVERGSAERDGTSFGNAGMVVPSHFIPLAAPGMVALGLKWMMNPASPFYIRPRLDAGLIDWGIKFWRAANARHVERAAPLLRDLSMAGRECFEELAALPGMDFGLVKNGLLVLCRTPHALDEETKVARQAHVLGIAAHVLDAGQAAVLDPGARMEIAGAVHFPMDCHFRPERFLAALQVGLEQLGVEFLWGGEVVDFVRDGGRRIRAARLSDSREIEADEFVLCSGAWSPALASRLALRLPMQAGKGYSLTLPKPRQLPQVCSILAEARVAVTPMDGRLRVGGTMEIAGLDERINPVRVRGIIDAFCRYFPDFTPADFEGIRPWSGLRPCSPDGLPYVGRVAQFDNLSVSTGHAMMGMSLGPISGRLMAQMLAGERTTYDLTMLSPNRYH
jgi:D-amino-acid dehydrogenase